MGLIIFLALLGLPVVEIALYVKLGGAIGWLSVILMTIGTALLGAALIRIQGFQALRQLQRDMVDGRVPVAPAVDGVFLAIAAPLLMTPGFVTDFLGFSLLVPAVRHALARYALKRIKRGMENGQVRVVRFR
ncbi:MAG: FxsA family protein [Parvularcula sp.]